MSKYQSQWAVLGLLFLAWGMIGLARNAINYLFPYIQVEFALGSGHMGFLSATLAICWALGIVFSGKYYNQLGAVKIMVPGLILAALATAGLGLSAQVVLLYLFVGLIGLGAGVICTPSFSLLATYSDPRKRGMFMGIMQSAFQLIGVAGGSILLSYLGQVSGWRGSYFVLSGVFVAFAMFLFYSLQKLNPNTPPVVATQVKQREEKSSLFRSRNMKIASVATCFCTIWSFTVTAYTIIYLIEGRGFSAVTAGIIFSGFGLGGFLGNILGATISDFLGRKPSIMFCCLCNVGFFMTFLTIDAGPMVLAGLLFASSFFYSGMSPIVITIIPSEAVATDLIAKATALTPSIGEVFGGVLAPVLAGICLSYLPIGAIMQVLSFAPLLVLGLSFFLEETAPRVLARKKVDRQVVA